MMKTWVIDKKAAEPIYLKMARYKPKEMKSGNEKPIAAINAIHCWP
jgi:hypothetical protein